MEFLKVFCNINPKEILKNQMKFKQDVGEIKIWKSKFKIKRSNKCYIECWFFFWFKRKYYWF